MCQVRAGLGVGAVMTDSGSGIVILLFLLAPS
jgi:hypothetical protein